MGRRKGEMTAAVRDREYPHQIAMQEDTVTSAVSGFADALSVCSRGHAFFHNDTWHNVFCFKEKADAEKFRAQFGGEWFDPARRGRGKRWHLLREPKKRRYG
jgi:hypothetical protein